MELRDLIFQDMAEKGFLGMSQISKEMNIARCTLDRLLIKNEASRNTIRKASFISKRPIREYEECEFTLI